MKQNYTNYKIENYILKITGVFNYDNNFISKSEKQNYEEIKYSTSELDGFKDYFYPDFRKQFFSNEKTRHTILVKKEFDNSSIVLSKLNKESKIKVIESRLDLFEDGFGLFTLQIIIDYDDINLFNFSDAAFLTRNFETPILNNNYQKWHEYIDNEILLGSITKGNTIKVDEYSGSKYKLFMILDLPDLTEKEEMNYVLFDIGTLSRIGSAIVNSYDSMDKNYIDQLIKNNSISVYNNYKGLALLDTFTVVGNKILDIQWKKDLYGSVYHGIYLYCLFLKYDLFKYNFEIADLDEDKRTNFQDFLNKYYYSYISYNFLPTEIYSKIKIALDIDKELKLLNEKIISVSQKIQEEQQDRTNKILGVVTVLTTISSIEPIYDYIIEGQKLVNWSVEVYWITIFTVVFALGIAACFYVFGKNILKWINKLKM